MQRQFQVEQLEGRETPAFFGYNPNGDFDLSPVDYQEWTGPDRPWVATIETQGGAPDLSHSAFRGREVERVGAGSSNDHGTAMAGLLSSAPNNVYVGATTMPLVSISVSGTLDSIAWGLQQVLDRVQTGRRILSVSMPLVAQPTNRVVRLIRSVADDLDGGDIIEPQPVRIVTSESRPMTRKEARQEKRAEKRAAKGRGCCGH